ncbi:hypothetical protein SAY86_015883 [Trapa natans]|uniref:Hexosyltransferase n=1 Tax=Trapa natans TaxID=22666 RepID=A0AAN7L9D5_TRANT|nr:hypothetical protein SAY86_015883 [Trapa natans]
MDLMMSIEGTSPQGLWTFESCCCPRSWSLVSFREGLSSESWAGAPVVLHIDMVIMLKDDDIVIQRDLSSLWKIDLEGHVNGAVETCRGEDEWVMSKRFKNYFNFSHPLIAKHLDPEECAWAYGMNVFDLHA